MSQNGEEVLHEIVLRDPESLLRKQLGDDVQVKSFETESFLKVGDNYGSTILKVHVVVTNKNDDKEEVLDLVAKMLPPTDFQRTIFESEFTFKKEIFIYEELVPLYKRLYKKEFNVTPKFYGSRLSLKVDDDVVDEDAVILMENLKVKGYYMVDRHKGLDLAHMKIAVTALAKFHAVGLSIKHKQPSFLATLDKYLKPLTLSEELMRPYVDSGLSAIKNDSVIGQYYDRFKAASMPSDILNEIYYHPINIENPWASVIHSDFWGNNGLFHKDEAGNVDDAKLVDFQTSYIASPLLDLVFLLCTSMEAPIKHFDEMLELYRITVLEILKELDCDMGLFEKASFEERLKIDAVDELLHIVLMVKVVELQEGEDVSFSPANEHCMRRLRRIFEIYVDKKWI